VDDFPPDFGKEEQIPPETHYGVARKMA
jgi:hypothetical protein